MATIMLMEELSKFFKKMKVTPIQMIIIPLMFTLPILESEAESVVVL